MADWPVIGGGQFAKQLNPDAATSSVSAASTISCLANDTKGSWAELVASTDETYIGLWVFVLRRYIATQTNVMIDIGIGASGSEVPILENFALSLGATYSHAAFYLPISIPAGSRISARGQTAINTDRSMEVSIVGVPGDYNVQSFQRAETYGAATATTTGAALPVNGTIHTKGSYVEITSATTREIKHLIIDLIWSENAMSDDRLHLIDIAVGSSGNEQVIISNIYAMASGLEVNLPSVMSLPVSIPAGSRIAARMQQTHNVSGYTIQLVLHGLS